MSDDVPDLEELDEGEEIEVYYVSQRSGNEVSRTAEVEKIKEGSDGPVVYAHAEERETFRHVYVVLVDAENTEGGPCVATYSVTAEPDGLEFDDHPELGETYTFTQRITRTQLLGIADRIVRPRHDPLSTSRVLGGSSA